MIPSCKKSWALCFAPWSRCPQFFVFSPQPLSPKARRSLIKAGSTTAAVPANGSYDLTFSLYNSTNLAGTVLAGPVTNSAVAVTNGLFTTTLDFGARRFHRRELLAADRRAHQWHGAFTTLSPRQPLMPVPYAIFANTASNLLGNSAIHAIERHAAVRANQRHLFGSGDFQ